LISSGSIFANLAELQFKQVKDNRKEKMISTGQFVGEIMGQAS
jgi:hypothetical protein